MPVACKCDLVVFFDLGAMGEVTYIAHNIIVFANVNKGDRVTPKNNLENMPLLIGGQPNKVIIERVIKKYSEDLIE